MISANECGTKTDVAIVVEVGNGTLFHFFLVAKLSTLQASHCGLINIGMLINFCYPSPENEMAVFTALSL